MLQPWAQILIILFSNTILITIIGFVVYKLLDRRVQTLPTMIGNSIKGARSVVGRVQNELLELGKMDISNFIEKNPLVVDVFPDMVQKGLEKNAQPELIGAMTQLLAPAITGLLVNNSKAPDALKAIASSGGGAIVGGIIKAFAALREQAKANYNPQEAKSDDSAKKKKNVHAQPKVKSI